MEGLHLAERMSEQGRKADWLRGKMGWGARAYRDRRTGVVALTRAEVERLRTLLIEQGDPLPLERLYDPTQYTPRP